MNIRDQKFYTAYFYALPEALQCRGY